MKTKTLIAIIILIIIPFSDLFSFTSSQSAGHYSIDYTKVPTKNTIIGSSEYCKEIQDIAINSGNRAAINKIINDFNKNDSEFDQNSPDQINEFYSLVSRLITNIGQIDMKIHYFRNKLNRVPRNLEELVRLNSVLPSYKRWHLLPVKGSLYHMQGKGGEYNLKFVSANGFCEAVYNKNGILLTEHNDPVNMGTFNYAAGMNEKGSHGKYDILPYLTWGNSINSPQKGSSEIGENANKAYERYLKNAFNVDAYRNKIIEEYSSNKAAISTPFYNNNFIY